MRVGDDVAVPHSLNARGGGCTIAVYPLFFSFTPPSCRNARNRSAHLPLGKKKEGAVSPLSVFPAGFYSKINEKTTVCGITRLRAAWCAS